MLQDLCSRNIVLRLKTTPCNGARTFWSTTYCVSLTCCMSFKLFSKAFKLDARECCVKNRRKELSGVKSNLRVLWYFIGLKKSQGFL